MTINSNDKTIHRKFIQALPSDNPYLSEEYIEVLKETFAHRPELLEAYLYGSWDALEGADQIIKAQWLREASGKTLVGWSKRPRLVCDTARFGDDETVIMYSEKTDVDEQWIMPYCRSTEISSKLASLSHQHGKCPCVVESIGNDLGAAVIDELVAMGVTVVVYTPQGKSNKPNIFYNQRAEVWDYSAKKLERGYVELKMESLSESDRTTLTNQLCTPKYRYRNGKTLVEPKADIKSRLGRSPDRGDTYVMLLWSYDRVPSVDEVYEEDMSIADSYAVVSAI